MAFCGQCGLLLSVQAIRCPRCGFPVTPSWSPEDQNPNDPTIIVSLDKTQRMGPHTTNPNTVAPVDSASFADYDSATQKAFDPASTPPQPTLGASYPGYQQPGTQLAGYSSPGISSPSLQSGNILPGSQQPAPSSPGYETPKAYSVPSTQSAYPNATAPYSAYPPPPAPRKYAPWGFITLALLFVGSTIAFFVIGPTQFAHIFTKTENTPLATTAPQVTPTAQPQVTPTPQDQPTPTPQQPTPSPTLSPVQQAQMVVKNYFDSLNSKDYQSAYNLWQNNPQTYQDFANGFSDTKHDDCVFGETTQLSDGTMQVNITLTATSNSDQQTVYTGYYIVGPMSDGTWKIITAQIAKSP